MTEPNIRRVLARVYVDSLEENLPFYECLAMTGDVSRFSYGSMKLARVGVFLLVEGADDEVKRHSATVAVSSIDPILDLLAKGGRIVEGPAEGPNGRRLVAEHPDHTVVEYIEVGFTS